MIAKILSPHTYDFQAPEVTLVRFSSRGFDKELFMKTAKEAGGLLFQKELAEMKPIPGKTVIHTIAVGDEEKYGSNRNNDGFSEKDNKTCHTRFKTHGHVFKNHDNDDPDKNTGEILLTGHNGPMSRIELIAALDNDKNADEVQALEEGKDVPVSMGSMQAYDVCSYCKHKAPESKDHCDHVKHMLGEVTKDGQQIYMQNPDPYYMDLSTVWKPADRIGYTLRKVALERPGVPGFEAALRTSMRKLNSSKYAMMMRLATIEKRIGGLAQLADIGPEPKDLDLETRKEIKKAFEAHGAPAMLNWLHKRGCVLSIRDFADFVVEIPMASISPDVHLAHDLAVKQGFHGLLKSAIEINSLDGAESTTPIRLEDDVVGSLDYATSMRGDHPSRRVLHATISGQPNVKLAGAGRAPDVTVSRGLADLYLHYKVAFAVHPTNNADEATLGALVQGMALSRRATPLPSPLSPRK